MTTALEKLKASLEEGIIDTALVAELERECRERQARLDALEEQLILIVRTGWPWDEDGEPNALFHAGKDGFAPAMAAARHLLGLDLRSRLTRTEPRT